MESSVLQGKTGALSTNVAINIKWSDAGIQSINFPCELGWTAYSNIMVTIVTRSWCVDYLQLQTYYEDLKIRKNTKGVHLCPL